MRKLALMFLALSMIVPVAEGAVETRREASFPMARGFDDRLTILSGEFDVKAPDVGRSAGFFRTTSVVVEGLAKACWHEAVALPPTCVEGPLALEVPSGSSFGFNPAVAYPVRLTADHALATFVDLSTADGFEERLLVGPSAIASLVGGSVRVGDISGPPAGRSHAFTVLEEGRPLLVRDAAGLVVHRLDFDDPPLLVEGSPQFPGAFGAQVVVLPFEERAQAAFAPASEPAAKAGLNQETIELLGEILTNVRVIGPSAKDAPVAILKKAGAFLSEIFNGAFVRTSLADDPRGFGDVAFAKFTDLRVSGGGSGLDFEGSYTLVVGDLGPSFDNSEVSQDSRALRWWVGLFLLVAIVVAGAWLWRRDGRSAPRAEPGPQTLFARIATVVGLVVAFLVWDWQLKQVLGSSLLTSESSGSAYGLLVLLELASLGLACLLIGVPVYLATRYGLALAKQPRYMSLATTTAVFFTIAFGVYLLPALVSFIAGLVA